MSPRATLEPQPRTVTTASVCRLAAEKVGVKEESIQRAFGAVTNLFGYRALQHEGETMRLREQTGFAMDGFATVEQIHEEMMRCAPAIEVSRTEAVHRALFAALMELAGSESVYVPGLGTVTAIAADSLTVSVVHPLSGFLANRAARWDEAEPLSQAVAHSG